MQSQCSTVQCGYVEKRLEEEEYIISRRNTISAGEFNNVQSDQLPLSLLEAADSLMCHGGESGGGFTDEENEGKEMQGTNLPYINVYSSNAHTVCI